MRRLIALAILLLLTACAVQPRAVVFDGTVYQIESTGVDTETYRGPFGESTLVIQRDAASTTVIVDEQAYRITGTESQVEVTFPDGRVLIRQYTGSGSSGMTGLGVDAAVEDWNRVEELREIVYSTSANEQRGQSGRKLLLGAFLFAIGLLQAVYPRLTWRISDGWKYQNVEPSDLYLTLSRIAGLVVMVIAAWVALGG